MKRVITVSLCLFAVMAFSLTSFAQELTTSAGNSNSVIIESPDALLFDQTGTPGANGAPSQYFPDFLAAGEAADDFIVPAGETWTIDTVFVVGTFSTTGLYVDIDINFFADDGAGLPGALADSRLGIAPGTAGVGPVFTVPLSPAVVLTEGTYWLNFMVNMNFSTDGQFFWSTSLAPVVNNEYAWRDSTGLFATPCTGMAWNYGASFCGVGGGVDPDLQFALYGSSSSGPVCTWLDDFEAGTGNWTITNDGGTCVWDIFLASEYTLGSTGAAGNVLAADADFCGSGTTTLTTATLNTPIDATISTLVLLDFDHDWQAIDADDSAFVEVSTDGGATWLNVVTYDVVDVRDTHESFDISGLVAGTNFLIRLRTVQPGWDWWWAVDNICVFADPVPVELTSFVASVNGNNVTLNWETATETNNQGFEIERNSGSGFAKIGYVAGFGTTTETHTYSFVDASVNEGSYSYRLKQLDFNGRFEYSDVIEIDVTIPDVFALEQNYPNPFNPSTKINFSLAIDSKVNLKVFDILGQEVATLINSNLVAGSHNVDFDASLLNSGVYFYRIEATGIDGTNFTNVKKMVLTK